MRGKRLAVVVGTLAVVGAGVAVPAGAVGSSPAGTRAVPHAASTSPQSSELARLQKVAKAVGGTVKWAVTKPIGCATETNVRRATCDGMRRITVKKSTPGARPYVADPVNQAWTGPGGGYSPQSIAAAYGVNPAGGSGQTIGIVDWYNDPTVRSDLNKYDTKFGLPKETTTSFRVVNQSGKASPLPSHNGEGDSSGEIALDVQDARGLCHKCKILLVLANQPSNADLDKAEDTAASLGATEISNSYGLPEYDDTSPNSQGTYPVLVSGADKKAFNHPGVVITASTGDNGWYSWDFANNGDCTQYEFACVSQNAPLWPSSSPNVVAVAGTEVFLNSGSRDAGAGCGSTGECVWNENGPDDENALSDGFWIGGAEGASGGGCSTLFNAPAWQSSMSGFSATGCGTKRMVGDIAAEADPATGVSVYDTGTGGWFVVGGTSLASPLVAAMWALAGGSHGVPYPGKTLYQNLTTHSSSAYDITSGGNGWCAGDDSANCGNVLADETTPSTTNPDKLTNPDGYGLPSTTNHTGHGDVAGLKDCSFPENYAELSGDPFSSECNAVPGYDGASGVGTPHGLGLFGKKIIVKIGGPSSGKHGKALSFNSTGSSDPNTGATITSYTWAWGDGKTSTGATAKHTWKTARTYTVKLTIKDNNGAHSTASKTVKIS